MTTRNFTRAKARVARGCCASVLCLSLSACADPLARVELLEDVTLAAESGEGVAALPSNVEAERDLGLFARLLGGDVAEAPEGEVAAETLESGEPVVQLGEAHEIDESQGSEKKGLFSFLKSKKPAPEETAIEAVEAEDQTSTTITTTSLQAEANAAPAAPAVTSETRKPLFGFLKRKPKTTGVEAGEPVPDDATALIAEAKDPASVEPSEALVAEAEEAKDKKGLLAWLRKEKGAPTKQEIAPVDSLPEVQTASLSPALGATRKDTPGLFSIFRSTPKDAPKPTGIPFGTRVAFGKAAPLCDYPKSQLGALVAQYPEDKPVYRLYDSQPGEKAAHAFYIKGFADGCLRQVTASVAVFGSVDMHEQLRYGLPADLHPYSDTDKAYEQLKRKICGVGKKKPCGEKLPLLAPNTVFLSLYDSYGNSQDWANLLLHDGQVMAKDLKTGDL